MEVTPQHFKSNGVSPATHSLTLLSRQRPITQYLSHDTINYTTWELMGSSHTSHSSSNSTKSSHGFSVLVKSTSQVNLNSDQKSSDKLKGLRKGVKKIKDFFNIGVQSSDTNFQLTTKMQISCLKGLKKLSNIPQAHKTKDEKVKIMKYQYFIQCPCHRQNHIHSPAQLSELNLEEIMEPWNLYATD